MFVIVVVVVVVVKWIYWSGSKEPRVGHLKTTGLEKVCWKLLLLMLPRCFVAPSLLLPCHLLWTSLFIGQIDVFCCYVLHFFHDFSQFIQFIRFISLILGEDGCLHVVVVSATVVTTKPHCCKLNKFSHLYFCHFLLATCKCPAQL